MQALINFSFLSFFSFSQQDSARRRWRLVPTCLICTRCVCMLARALVIIIQWALGCKFIPVDPKLFNKPNMLIKQQCGILKSGVCDLPPTRRSAFSCLPRQVAFVIAGVHPALHMALCVLCLCACERARMRVYACVHLGAKSIVHNLWV